MAIRCKLIDFVTNESDQFTIQMFGINSIRETFSITVSDFNPFVFWEKLYNFDLSEIPLELSL